MRAAANTNSKNKTISNRASPRRPVGSPQQSYAKDTQSTLQKKSQSPPQQNRHCSPGHTASNNANASIISHSSPNKTRVSPKGGKKGTIANGGAASAGVKGTTTSQTNKNTYSTAQAARRKQSPPGTAKSFDQGAGGSTLNSAGTTRKYGTARGAPGPAKSLNTQKSKLKQSSPTGARSDGKKAAPVQGHTYTRSVGATATGRPAKKNSFQQNVSKKIQGLKDLQIETYDAAKGRPSLMDIDNKQVFEGNFLPASFQSSQEQFTPQLGMHPLSGSNKSGFPNSQSNSKSTGNQIPSPATLGQISVKGINGPSQPSNLDSDSQAAAGATQFNSSQGMKFKKKSQIEEKQLNKILDTRARISINSQTGKHEFKYCQGLRASSSGGAQMENVHGQAYLQNSDSLVNFINDHNGGQLDQMAPIRPSNLIWQMPYEERRSFINQQCEFQLNRLSKANARQSAAAGAFGAAKAGSNQGAGLGVDRQDSVDFQKASGSDSEFEHIDDYVDEAEEFNGASRAVKLSIRALNFNMMLAEKQSEQDPSTVRGVSLLSRASNLIQNSQNTNKGENQKSGQLPQKNYDRSSKLLNSYIRQQASTQGRDSYMLMSGIDEREEYDEYSHTDSVHSNMQTKYGAGSKSASSRGSTIKHQYNFPTFFTPSQSSKKMTSDYMKAKQTATTTGQGKQIKFFGNNMQHQNFSQHHSQRQIETIERTVISEQEQEDSQAVDEEVTSSGRQSQSFLQSQHGQHQYISGKFSQQVSMMQDSFQEEPEDPDQSPNVEDDENTGDGAAAGEGRSEDYLEQDDFQLMGRNSRPSAQLQRASEFAEEAADGSEQQTQNTFHKHHQGGIVVDDPAENELFQQTQKVKREDLEHQQRLMKQSQSHAVSAANFHRSTENVEEQTEERFAAETGNSQPTSFVGQNIDKGEQVARGAANREPGSQDESLQVVEQNSSDFNGNQNQFQQARLKDGNQNLLDSSIHYYDVNGAEADGQAVESGPTQRSGALVDKRIQHQQEQQQMENLDTDGLPGITGLTERTDGDDFNDSFQNEDTSNAGNNGGAAAGSTGSIPQGHVRIGGGATQPQLQQNSGPLNASHSPTTLQHSALQSSGYPYVDRLKTTERNPLTMSENTTIERNDANFPGGAYQAHDVDPNVQNIHIASEESQQLQAPSYEQPQDDSGNGALNQFVTKVPQVDVGGQDGENSQQNLHQQHFIQTVQALQFIQNNIRVVEEHEMSDLIVQLPPPRFPDRQKKLAIFDMDETLIHCVDDIETQDPDIVLEIDFPDEETVYAGINIRPYIMECLEEANKHFQVIAFTASHQVYADAILDYIDPNHEFITHRLYRQHCFLTEEGYYVKDLRIFADRDLKDVVIVDNSVYSFAFQIDNGIPIIPFYNDKQDEEMLHLVYYLNCLAKADDVREQNRQAFELFKLSNGESLQNSTMATEAMPGQFDDNDNNEDGQHYEDGYFENDGVVDLTAGHNYGDVELQDPSVGPAFGHNVDLSSRRNYNIEEVIHEDRREDFNSYTESVSKSRQTNGSQANANAQGYIKQEDGREADYHDTEEDYKNVEEVTDVNEFSQDVDELSKTEESTSQVLYQPHPNMLYGGQQYPANQGQNAYMQNNMNNQMMQQQQLRNQQDGDVRDPDDEGANFYIGTDGENAPPDDHSNLNRYSCQFDDTQEEPYIRDSQLTQNEGNDEFQQLRQNIQNTLNCQLQQEDIGDQYQFISQQHSSQGSQLRQ